MRKRSFVALVAAVLALSGPSGLATVSPKAQFLSATTWSEPRSRDRFGGLSGITLSQDGTALVAVSDQGTIWRGKLTRTDGTLIGITQTDWSALHDPDGAILEFPQVDAEGLAQGTDGTFYVSFEGDHRIWSYAQPTGVAKSLKGHPDFRRLQNNSSLEALAIDAKGQLYTIPERSGKVDRPFPVYRRTGTTWRHAFDIPRRPPYLVVGADIGPDGRFYLLERHLSGIFGFKTRVRRFDMTPKALVNEALVLETSLSTHGNLEGISVWRDPDRGLRMTMIADDNFKSFLATEIVEYALTE